MAKFDLYPNRKGWWWYYYLSLAAAKGSTGYPTLVELIFDAVDYEDNYGTVDRKEIIAKYNGKNGSFKTRI